MGDEQQKLQFELTEREAECVAAAVTIAGMVMGRPSSVQALQLASVMDPELGREMALCAAKLAGAETLGDAKEMGQEKFAKEGKKGMMLALETAEQILKRLVELEQMGQTVGAN